MLPCAATDGVKSTKSKGSPQVENVPLRRGASGEDGRSSRVHNAWVRSCFVRMAHTPLNALTYATACTRRILRLHDLTDMDGKIKVTKIDSPSSVEMIEAGNMVRIIQAGNPRTNQVAEVVVAASSVAMLSKLCTSYADARCSSNSHARCAIWLFVFWTGNSRLRAPGLAGIKRAVPAVICVFQI